MTASPTTERMAELIGRRERFVHATVVRAQEPTSAHTGDEAIVRADGCIEGFVGGQCAAGSVRVAALDVLASGSSTLLRILPEGAEDFPESPGACVVVNPCLSGGALEIFLEAIGPPPVCHVAGESPIAVALASLAPQVGFAVTRTEAGESPEHAVAAVVARHGGDEPADIRAALDAGVPFVGLVASRRRGEALLADMHLTPEERARIHTPVGVDIGATTPTEIAVSILAELIAQVRREAAEPAAQRTELPVVQPETAVDPVCGMTVVIGPDAIHLEVDGEDYWFCCPGCRDRFAAERSA